MRDPVAVPIVATVIRPETAVSGGERDGALGAETTVERWRVVVVALATVAALPLFVLEDPKSPGSLAGTAGASAAPAVDKISPPIQVVELVVASDSQFVPH